MKGLHENDEMISTKVFESGVVKHTFRDHRNGKEYTLTVLLPQKERDLNLVNRFMNKLNLGPRTHGEAHFTNRRKGFGYNKRNK